MAVLCVGAGSGAGSSATLAAVITTKMGKSTKPAARRRGVGLASRERIPTRKISVIFHSLLSRKADGQSHFVRTNRDISVGFQLATSRERRCTIDKSWISGGRGMLEVPAPAGNIFLN